MPSGSLKFTQRLAQASSTTPDLFYCILVKCSLPIHPRSNPTNSKVAKMVAAPPLDPRKFTKKIYLNGAYVDSQSPHTFSLKNPKDGSTVVDGIPICEAADVDAAVAHAEAAFNGPWSKFTAMQRMTCFHKLAELVEEQLVPILTLDSLTSGNPVSIIPTREKNYIKNTILYYSGWCDKQKGDYFPADDGMGKRPTSPINPLGTHTRDYLGFTKLVRHEPMGVCAGINAFNAPVATMFLKCAPALCTGNVIIMKPSEKDPLGTLAIAPLFALAGFPPGVLQVVTGPGSTGALLASHMRIRKVSFTGSVPHGEEDPGRGRAEQSEAGDAGDGREEPRGRVRGCESGECAYVDD